MKQTYIWQKKSKWHWELISLEEKAKYLRALKANADSGLLYRIWVTKKNYANITKKMFNKLTVIFRVYAHNKSNWCKLVIT